MNQNTDLYYYSEEFFKREFPVVVKVLRYLSIARSTHKAAVVGFSEKIEGYDDEYVVLAKGNSLISEAFSGGVVGVYLFPIDERVAGDTWNMGQSLGGSKDWGAITNSREMAMKNRVSEEKF